MELRIYIRQKKVFNAQGQEIYFDGNSPQSIQVVPISSAPFPNNRKFPDYGNFVDVTDHASDLYKLKLTWTKERGAEGEQLITDLDQKKSATGNIIFEGTAYQLIKKWLIDDISAPLNVIEVEIRHIGCGNYTGWTIRATDLTWCEDEICTFNVTLKQQDEPLTCVKNTLISDNWQGWFPTDSKIPKNGKRHPRFSYCNEERPNGKLVALWWVMILLLPVYTVILLIIASIWNPLVAVLVAILSIVKIIVKVTGGDTTDLENRINQLKNSTIDFKDIQDIAAAIFIESSGCGREHPAPLIRDYISNVCDKCGITVNNVTAPIFFSEFLNVETSMDRDAARPAQSRWNPYYRACFLGAVSQKGIRRLNKVSLTQGQLLNTTDYWLPQNSPIITLAELLDLLKNVFNAEWRVVNGTLYFQRKDYWLDSNYAFDFTQNASDRALLLQGICYEWTGEKYPAIIRGLYTEDGADTAGNDALHFMNGTINVGNTILNPNIEGVRDISAQVGATKFRLDGAASDYILDAYQQLSNSSFTSGVVWAATVVKDIDNELKTFADYALLLTQETTTLPKILIWDESSGYTNAKCYRPLAVSPNFGWAEPSPNPRYNNYQGVKKFPQLKITDTSVLGNGGVNVLGQYTVVPRVGFGNPIRKTAVLVNYQMYFEPGFQDTLWDWFHWIDDPTFNPVLHQEFTAKIELCCETLKDRIMPFNDGDKVILGQKVALPESKYYTDGVITEVTVSYDTSDTLGQYIEIKGRR